MRFTEKQIITNGDMSQATVISIGIPMQQVVNWAIQAVWTGSPVGNFKIQVSNDIVPQAPVVSGGNQDPALNVVNWSDYSGSTQASGGGAGNFMWTSQNAAYQWIRLVYTKTSGTGTVNATFNGNGV